MAKVTSKLQVTVPKKIADQYGIQPGDEIEWVAAGETIRIIPPGRATPAPNVELRVRLFDAATARQRNRQRGRSPSGVKRERGWTRQDLYSRARAR